MTELTRTDEESGAWYPVTIHKLETYLGKYIESGHAYKHAYSLKKDLAYNLQYLQFQDRVIMDIKLSSVLYTQTIKTIILVSCSIIESILHYSLIKKEVYSDTEWKQKATFKGNQKKLDGENVRIDTVIYSKLPKKELKHMTFDAMIKSAKSNSIFGSRSSIYEKLETLRKLRNRVHLQPTDDKAGTDWTTFTTSLLNETYIVMYSIFTSSLFEPTKDEEEFFSYLRKQYGA
jgi:hypothetical protein